MLKRRILLALTLCLGAVAARACSIPVFRYALDRWPADPYTLEVSPADAREPGVAHFLRNFTDNTPLNLTLVRLTEEGVSRLTFPHAAPEQPPVWSGTLDPARLSAITDSPARAEIIRRIVDGESGVWLLVESGQREADDRAAAVLEKRLKYLEQVAQVPPIDPNDPSSQLGPGPALRVKFSLIRVRRDEPGEQPFVQMLAGPKDAIANAAGPWLALAFGRGRVLGAWPAEDFGDEQIDEACLFLLGACSCQVKRMNPGWDLVLKVDWNEALQSAGATAVPAAVAEPPAVAPPAVETVTIAADAPAPAVLPAPKFGRNVPVMLGVLLLGAVFLWARMRKS